MARLCHPSLFILLAHATLHTSFLACHVILMSTKPVPLSPDQPCTDRQEHKIGKLAKLDRILLARGGIDDSGIFPNAIWRGGGAKKFVIAKRGSGGQRIPSLSRRWNMVIPLRDFLITSIERCAD